MQNRCSTPPYEEGIETFQKAFLKARHGVAAPHPMKRVLRRKVNESPACPVGLQHPTL